MSLAWLQGGQQRKRAIRRGDSLGKGWQGMGSVTENKHVMFQEE